MDSGKPFDKIKHPFILRTLGKSEIEENYFNLIKGIYKKSIAIIKINDKI